MSNLEELNLQSTVNLYNNGSLEKPAHHFLYASQLHGTTFAVYGRFHIEASEDNMSCLIKKITLKLINYKGSINIGFTGNKALYDGNENVFFAVRGGGKITNKKLSFRTPISIKKGEPFLLVFNRILYPMKGFEFDIDERSKRKPSEILKVEIPRKRIFDDEFQYRNGTGYYDRVLRPGMLGFEKISMENALELSTQSFFPSLRCHQSRMSLLF